MSDPASWFTLGGPFMVIVSVAVAFGAVLVLLALSLAAAARITGKMGGLARLFCSLALVAAFVPACAGLTGQWWGERVLTERSLDAGITSAADESDYEAAAIPRNFGCGSTVCCVLPALLAIMVLPRRRHGRHAPPD